MWAVVGDVDPVSRKGLEEVLARAGFLVIGCGDRRQLLTAARRVKPALLVCDVDLARPLSGAAACRRLSREGLASAVVLMARDDRAARAIPLPQAWQILSKPVRSELLLGLALWALRGAP